MEYTLSNQIEWLPNQGWDPRIHIAANADLVNVFLLVTERYLILVDTLLNPTAAKALVQFSQPYLSTRQLLVINSHADWDHAWGNQLFVGPDAPFPAPVIAHSAATARYADPEEIEYLHDAQRRHPDIFSEVTLTQPTLTFNHDFWIDGGDLTLHLFPTPGHTLDHIAIFIPEISMLLAGDAAEIPFPMIDSANDLPVLRASLKKMQNLQPHHVLYCHAPPEVGPQLLHDNIAYYDALEGACRTAIANRVDTAGLTNAELPNALNCRFEDITPTTGAWAEVTFDSRTEQHGENLRLMLEWVASTNR